MKTAIGANDQAKAAMAPATPRPAIRYSAHAANPEAPIEMSVPVTSGGTPIKPNPANNAGNPGKKAACVNVV